MADSNTTHYAFVQPQVGASLNTWGTKLNNDLASIDSILWAVSAGINQGVNTQSSAASITLTNPIVSVQQITFTAGSQKLVFPAMNTATSAQAGAQIRIINAGAQAFQVVAQDTSTQIVSSLPAGASTVVTVLSNATANGTFNSVPTGSGTFLTVLNNLSDLNNVTTARTNLGLGTAALQNTGTSGANLPFMNGTNTWTGSQSFTGATINVATQTAGNNTTLAASTAFVTSALSGLGTASTKAIAFFLQAANNLSDLASLSTALTNLGFGYNLSTNGHANFPGGFQVRWGYINTSGGSGTLTFDQAFTNQCFGAVLISANGTENTSGWTPGVTGRSTTAVSMFQANVGNSTYFVIAVGN